jgi:hypothetical protein
MIQKQREEMNPLIIDRRKGDYDDRLWEYWAIDMAQ